MAGIPLQIFSPFQKLLKGRQNQAHPLGQRSGSQSFASQLTSTPCESTASLYTETGDCDEVMGSGAQGAKTSGGATLFVVSEPERRTDRTESPHDHPEPVHERTTWLRELASLT